MHRSELSNRRRARRPVPSLGEQASQKLRAAILAGHVKPGEHLVQEDLCARTGVSRTCVREALQLLESEGLVERSPTQGHLVASVTPDEARQIYEIRAALEPAMARLFVARADAKQVATLAAAAGRIEAAIRGAEMDRYVAGLHDFYHALLAGAGNDVARRFLATLDARVTYLRRMTAEKAEPERRLETAAMLRTIVDAAAARDAEAMATRCCNFVMRSERFALSVLDDMRAKVPVSTTRRAAVMR